MPYVSRVLLMGVSRLSGLVWYNGTEKHIHLNKRQPSPAQPNKPSPHPHTHAYLTTLTQTGTHFRCTGIPDHDPTVFGPYFQSRWKSIRSMLTSSSAEATRSIA